MVFAKHIREKVMDGSVTCSVRIWQSARVKVGGRYRVGVGEIEVMSVKEISLGDITPALARKSGFAVEPDPRGEERLFFGRAPYIQPGTY